MERSCVGCGGMVPQPLGRKPRKWCSDACRVRHSRKPATPAAPTARTCQFCEAPFDAVGCARRCPDCVQSRRRGRRRPCVWCGVEFWANDYNGQRFCDRSCASLAKAVARGFDPSAPPAGKGHRQRALRYGAECEPVDRMAVFERDGWLCLLCETPVRRHVAWPDPESPSLDHIVPLSAGGAHTYLNVQCAHLRCNIAKGANLHGWSPALV